MKKLLLVICLLVQCTFLFAQEFNGYWESNGYGLVIDVSDEEVVLYDLTSISFIPVAPLPLDGNLLGDSDEVIGSFELEEDLLVLKFSSLIENSGQIVFKPISELPEVTEATNDPMINFNIFWQTYQEYCALFNILDIDWEEQYDIYSAQINDTTSQEELFDLLVNMFDPLNDGHSYLFDEENGKGHGGGPEIVGLWEDYGFEFRNLIEVDYIDADTFITALNEQVSYGIINETTGYLMINAFQFSDGGEKDDNMLFSEAMDEAFEYLNNTEGLIIDVRYNSGGFDSNARILGGRLTKQEQVVCTKQACLKEGYDQFSDPIEFKIVPHGVQYVDKPVVVLTSQLAASAGDVFCMLAKEIDCVTTMGQASFGIFSDIYSKVLPNGWVFGFSPERYLDVNGVDHEQVGIIPDVLVEENLDSLINGKDNVLDYALSVLPSSCEMTSISTLEKTFSVYPNPFNSSFRISSNINHGEDWTIRVFDLNGRLVYEKESSEVSIDENIDLSNLPNGWYNLSIESSSSKENIKLIKTDL